jgi:hypothetical protein
MRFADLSMHLSSFGAYAPGLPTCLCWRWIAPAAKQINLILIQGILKADDHGFGKVDKRSDTVSSSLISVNYVTIGIFVELPGVMNVMDKCAHSGDELNILESHYIRAWCVFDWHSWRLIA